MAVKEQTHGEAFEEVGREIQELKKAIMDAGVPAWAIAAVGWLARLFHSFGFHSWSAWSEPERHMNYLTKEIVWQTWHVQHRTCAVCRKYEERTEL